MNRPLGIAGLVAAVVASLAIAAGSAALAAYSWGQVADYRSPFLARPLPPAAAGPAHSRRVVLVIVDGLRYDTAKEMTALQTLGQHGNALMLTAPQPSLSYPDWTTILSGAPQQVSGVTTNGIHEHVRVETLLDTARSSGLRTVAVGPWMLDTLYGARMTDGRFFEDYKKNGPYLSTGLVQRTLSLVTAVKPSFVLLHLPDVDEAGHAYGGASKQYADTAQKVDRDLSVLFNGLQDGHTTFVVVSDHGHIATGGHGGWERDVLDVPAVFAGSGVALGSGSGKLQDVAPTVAAIAGIPTPRDSIGRVLPSVLSSPSAETLAVAHEQRIASVARYLTFVTGSRVTTAALLPESDAALDKRIAGADAARLASERAGRGALAGLLVVGALVVLVAVAALSWRALVAALAGTVAYYLVYDGLFFLVHHLNWSLSAINSEDRMNAFFLGRLGEAALGGLVAALVAGIVYPLLRREPKGVRGRYRLGWLALGPAAILVVQATLALQAAWYVRQWGVRVTWLIPDLRWGFKFDLDLMQAVALGAAAVLAPVVTLLVGRYHPRVARAGEDAPATTDNERVLPHAAEE